MNTEYTFKEFDELEHKEAMENIFLDGDRLMEIAQDAIFQSDVGEEVLLDFLDLEFPAIEHLTEIQKDHILKAAYRLNNLIVSAVRKQADLGE